MNRFTRDDVPVLLDAKRGDMGPTAKAYATAIFEELGADAVTLAPYLGRDSVAPFLNYPDRGLFVLAHTSNPTAATFQHLVVEEGGGQLFSLLAPLHSTKNVGFWLIFILIF